MRTCADCPKAECHDNGPDGTITFCGETGQRVSDKWGDDPELCETGRILLEELEKEETEMTGVVKAITGGVLYAMVAKDEWAGPLVEAVEGSPFLLLENMVAVAGFDSNVTLERALESYYIGVERQRPRKAAR